MKMNTLIKKVQVLEHAFAANAGAYYNINLSKNIVPGTMYQVIDEKEYSINKQIGMPENASFSEVVKYWSAQVPEDEKPAYFETLNAENLLARFAKGETHVWVKYWTKTALFEPMLAEQHVVMYQDDETGDVLAISYVIDLTKDYKKNQYKEELEKSRKEMEQALESARKANKAKTSFLHNMSHDIRTPINGIIGMLSIIKKRENDPERIKDCLAKIEDSSKLLLSLVNDVLDIAKLESDATENNKSINLDQVCAEITDAVVFQAEQAGLHVTGEHDDYHDVYVWGNALYLKKILMNLFTNSIKYNKPNGSIQASMKTLEVVSSSITCEFKIKDTGIGMSEEFMQNELFTPFVQEDKSVRSSYMGTGLGMPIVKELVEKMGGTISVESKLGEGSCFTVVIPFKIDHNPKQKAKIEEAAVDFSGLHVLLVEDNELNMEIAEFMLKEEGIHIDKATNGKEAVDKFELSKPGTYDVIFMDIMMPVMDGLTATKSIRELDRPDAKNIPIIAMTANAFKEDVEKCIEVGMNAHVAKPLDVEIVKKALASVLKK